MSSFIGVAFEIIVILFSVVLHEVAHGVMAYSLGDTTAKDAGRLTLNPFKHLDLVGSVLLPVFLLAVGAPVFGYAKPVPYNPLNLRDRKFGPAKVALAGPLTNLVLAVLAGFVLRFLPFSLWGDSIFPNLLAGIVQINLLLAIFNLMPIPPLDGHWLFITLLPHRFENFKIFILRYSIIIFIVFLIFIFPAILPLINFLFKAIVGKLVRML